MAKRPTYLQFANDETPPPLSTAILAFQHSAIVLINLVYVVIITKALNLSAADQFAMLSTTLLVCGLATLLQARFGSKLLIVFHPNPIYIPLIIAAGLTEGPAGIAVLLLSAGVVQFVFGSLVRRLRVFFPPEVCGVVVIMLGVSLLPGTLRGIVTQSVDKTFMHVESAGLITALVTLAVASAGSVWLRGMARFFSLLLGCVAGMIVAYALGIWQFGETSTALDVPAFALPSIHLPGFTFSIGLVYLAVVAALVNVVDELGVLIGTERLDDAEWRRPDFRKMSLGLQASGLFTAISGALGGAAMGMSSANLSLAYATGVTSRAVAMAAGAILIGVAFVPLALKNVLSLPDAVVAGILFYAACYFIVSGAELALSRMLSPRRALVIGLSVGAGVLLQSVPTLTSRFAGTSIEHVLAPMTFATIVAIVLNLFMRIGIKQTEKMIFAGPGAGANSDEILKTLGERWGMHRQTATRAAAAMNETLELLDNVAKGPIDCTITYNELALVMRFAYEGRPLVLPGKMPSVDDLTDKPDGVMQMGGWIVRKLSDYSSVSFSGGKQQLNMAFEC
ncbi:MAG: solute carrier family 23 protein [Aestuariivirga sp.]|uniref:uracil-xanthine permease family protein n=1 Tax=Aestuariivirga sp. TaxID=2650926 RepID=UPI00301AFF7D